MSRAFDYNFTQKMDDFLRRYNDELSGFYCQADIRKKLKELKKADPDARFSIMYELKLMCEKMGIDARALVKDASLIEKAPTREQQKEQLLKMLHDIYAEFPSSSDYMRRMILRLAPEYAGDTVRLAILKRFLEGCDRNCKTIKVGKVLDWAYDRLDEADKAKFEKLDEAGRKRMLVVNVTDEVFGTGETELTPVHILEVMLKRLSECVEKNKTYRFVDSDGSDRAVEDFEVSDNTLKAVQDACVAAGVPVSDNVAGMIEALTGKADAAVVNAAVGSFIDKLEKEFRAQMRRVMYAKRTGGTGNAAELYKYDRRYKLESLNPGWDILDMCEDLASGSFHVNGVTKEQLYYFAFVFGMKVVFGKNSDVDVSHDMVKNLFYDYYADNLLRFLEDEYQDSAARAKYDSEPTGEGVNYKNFVECIYVYYLNNTDTGANPGERIDKAKRLIDKCIKNGLSGRKQKRGEGEYTRYYRDMVIERMMALSEDELEDFVCDNFRLRSSVEGDNSRMMIGAEEKTAFDIIDRIYDEIAESFSETLDPFSDEEKDELRAEYNEDRNYAGKIAIEWDVYRLLKEGYGSDEKFMRVIDAIDMRLNTREHGIKSYRIPEITENLKKKQRENEARKAYAASARVTRSGMLAAMYQDFIMEIEDIGGDYENLMDMYTCFTSKYDSVLDEARYQRISPKNLLDMYVIISLYFRVIVEKGEAEGDMYI